MFRSLDVWTSFTDLLQISFQIFCPSQRSQPGPRIRGGRLRTDDSDYLYLNGFARAPTAQCNSISSSANKAQLALTFSLELMQPRSEEDGRWAAGLAISGEVGRFFRLAENGFPACAFLVPPSSPPRPTSEGGIQSTASFINLILMCMEHTEEMRRDMMAN